VRDNALVARAVKWERHQSRWFDLLFVASELSEEGRDDYAVIAAQTAVEVSLESNLVQMLAWHSPGPLSEVVAERLLRRPWNLADDRLVAVWDGLTGDEVRQQDWWESYAAHLKRRHAVVHAGRTVSKEEADESLKAAFSAVQYINDAYIKLGVAAGKFREHYHAGAAITVVERAEDEETS
jgi:hypothetical protein